MLLMLLYIQHLHIHMSPSLFAHIHTYVQCHRNTTLHTSAQPSLDHRNQPSTLFFTSMNTPVDLFFLSLNTPLDHRNHPSVLFFTSLNARLDRYSGSLDSRSVAELRVPRPSVPRVRADIHRYD